MDEDLDGEDMDGEDWDGEDRDQEMDGDGANIGSNKGGSIDDEYHDFYNEIYGKDGCYSAIRPVHGPDLEGFLNQPAQPVMETS